MMGENTPSLVHPLMVQVELKIGVNQRLYSNSIYLQYEKIFGSLYAKVRGGTIKPIDIIAKSMVRLVRIYTYIRRTIGGFICFGRFLEGVF